MLSVVQCLKMIFSIYFVWSSSCLRWKGKLVPVTPSLLEEDAKNIQSYNMDIRLFQNEKRDALLKITQLLN